VTDTNDQAQFTPTDPQSRAFREATDADHWHNDVNTLIQREGAAYHEPITDISQVRHPEDYEVEGWDDDRDGPKNVTEARDALAARIAHPSAPDTDAEAGAYDSMT
jgi:hypothetical protein